MEDKWKDMLLLIQKFKDFFNGTLGTQKMEQVGFKLKWNAKTVWWILYPVSKVFAERFKSEVGLLVLIELTERANNSECA